MDKNTLSNYGWIIVVTLVLAVMLSFATPFGKYVGEGVVSVANGMAQAGSDALKEDNINSMEGEWSGKFNYETLDFEKAALNPSKIVPRKGTYYVGVFRDGVPVKEGENDFDVGDYTGATNIIGSGNEFPEVQIGDVFVYGDYEYRYGYAYCCCGSWDCCNTTDGWGVMVRNGYRNKEQFGEILESINGQPVTATTDTFLSCDKMTSVPTIPPYVTDVFCMMDNNSEITGVIKVPCGAKTSAEEDELHLRYSVEYYHFEGCGH